MSNSVRFRLLLGIVVVGVGAVDAMVTTEWDLLAAFALAAVVLVSLLFTQWNERTALSVRADLGRALRRRAEAAGEPLDDVVDRLIAASELGLYPTDHEPG